MSEKLYYHTCNNTLAHTCKVIDNNHVNNVFSYLIMLILKAIKSHFEGTHDSKGSQNLTYLVIPYDLYETRQRLVS